MSANVALNPASTNVRLPRPAGFRNVATSVGYSGEAIRLWVSDAGADAVFAATRDSGGASFPKTHTEQSYAARVLITTASGTVERPLSSMTATFPIVQPTPEGNLLVVGARCQRFQDGTHEMNAVAYRADGSILRKFCLGDGIEHVQVDSSGRIWVGYFDEGVFGNFGWGSHEGAEPLGSAGLVCYDPLGKKLWAFHPPARFDFIMDCYSLNVAEDKVWTCYYTEFPIVSVDPTWHARGWATSLRGVRAMAVAGDSVLAYGGYGEHTSACKLLRLGNGTAEAVTEVQLRLPEGVNLRESTVIGRGGMLHVFAEDDWYTFSPEV